MPFQYICETCGEAFFRDKQRHGYAPRFCSSACRYTLPVGHWQSDGTVLVPLTHGKFAVVDVDDADRVLDLKWWAERSRNTWYATHTAPRGVTPRRVYMHRLILGASPGEQVDHVDGNGLRNVRSNIRRATTSQNQCNRRMSSNNTSGFRGVIWFRNAHVWRAQIKIDGRNHYLGYFATAEDAARAYDVASRQLHGEFGRTNFPD